MPTVHRGAPLLTTATNQGQVETASEVVESPPDFQRWGTQTMPALAAESTPTARVKLPQSPRPPRNFPTTAVMTPFAKRPRTTRTVTPIGVPAVETADVAARKPPALKSRKASLFFLSGSPLSGAWNSGDDALACRTNTPREIC